MRKGEYAIAYQDMATPYERLRSLPEAESDLNPGATLENLDAIAAECGDNGTAQRLNECSGKALSTNKTQHRVA